MLTLPPAVRVYIGTGPCDLRKQFDGIALLVEQTLRLEPRSGHLFVVFNRRGDQVRILFWDRNGYCIWATQYSRDGAADPPLSLASASRHRATGSLRAQERPRARCTV